MLTPPSLWASGVCHCLRRCVLTKAAFTALSKQVCLRWLIRKTELFLFASWKLRGQQQTTQLRLSSGMHSCTVGVGWVCPGRKLDSDPINQLQAPASLIGMCQAALVSLNPSGTWIHWRALISCCFAPRLPPPCHPIREPVCVFMQNAHYTWLYVWVYQSCQVNISAFKKQNCKKGAQTLIVN